MNMSGLLRVSVDKYSAFFYVCKIDFFLQSKDSENLKFRDEWNKIRPTVLALLNQSRVTKPDWQGLFFAVHVICSWIDDSSTKLIHELNVEIENYVKAANRVGCCFCLEFFNILAFRFFFRHANML
jgi:hypothetical protein